MIKMIKMKKLILVVCALMIVGMFFSSCRSLKNCPAYSIEFKV